jgi:ElaB/YqjD/DUF883 family membrane-anchored ribosome-binding protein
MSDTNSAAEDTAKGIPGELRDKAADVVHKVREAGERLRDNVREVGGHVRDQVRDKVDHVREKVEHLREGAGEYIQSGKAKARELENDVENFVREKPLHALLLAAAIGLLIGLIWRRR